MFLPGQSRPIAAATMDLPSLTQCRPTDTEASGEETKVRLRRHGLKQTRHPLSQAEVEEVSCYVVMNRLRTSGAAGSAGDSRPHTSRDPRRRLSNILSIRLRIYSALVSTAAEKDVGVASHLD